jgi:hypothetical protein
VLAGWATRADAAQLDANFDRSSAGRFFVMGGPAREPDDSPPAGDASGS